MSAITVGNLVIDDLNTQLEDTKRRRACLCGSTNDPRNLVFPFYVIPAEEAPASETEPGGQ